jgi:hypothetical protein
MNDITIDDLQAYPYPGDAGRAPDREAAAWALTPVMGANLRCLDRDMQASVQEHTAFTELQDYYHIASTFLQFLQRTGPTRIVSPNPSARHYIFFQYPADSGFRITRSLNSNLFLESLEGDVPVDVEIGGQALLALSQ